MTQFGDPDSRETGGFTVSTTTGRSKPADRTESAAKLLIANPGAVTLVTDTGHWVIAGDPTDEIEGAIEDEKPFQEVRQVVADLPGEYSLFHLAHDGVLRAHRGITSCHDVFYLSGSDGTRLLTDQFRNAVANLDVDDRTVTEDIIADHLLYRTTPTGTYIEEVGRLGHGESLSWDPDESEPSTTLWEVLQSQPLADLETVLSDLDRTLTDMMGDPDSHRVMLSGGIDSTLLGTYEPKGAETLSGAYDSPEFAVEVDYAQEASELLGTDHQVLIADEEDYLADLEEAIDAIAMPLQQSQTPMQGIVYDRGGHRAYINGQLADSLFGLNAGRAALVWNTRWLRYLPSVVPQLETHRLTATRLLRPPTSPQGYALQTVQYLPQDLLSEMIDQDTIDARQRNRLGYVRDRVPLTASTADLATHLEWGHWIEYFCENVPNTYRQMAQAYGTTLTFPFANSAVVDIALSLPSPERYVDRFESKHVLKKLLDRRLPEYRTTKGKQNGNLPVPRFFTDGPLEDVFETYPMPDFVPENLAADLPQRSTGLALILAFYAIWRDRVLANDDVTVVDGTRTLEL